MNLSHTRIFNTVVKNLIVRAEESGLSTIFWHNNNTLYLKTIDHNRQESVYLKFKVQQTVGDMLENVMPNEAVRPAPIKQQP